MTDELPDAPWISSGSKTQDLPDAPWLQTSASTHPGEQEAQKDIELLKKHQGMVPDALKAGLYSAGEAGAFDLPTYIAAAASQKPGQAFTDSLNEQRAYKEALQRQHPTASMAGTGTGFLGSLLLPVGPAAKLATAAGRGAELLGAGQVLKSAASAVPVGATYGLLGGLSEKYGTDKFTPAELAKSTALGAGTAAVLTPALEKVLAKGVPPAEAEARRILESQGVVPSKQMITGEAPAEGMPQKAADEMTAKAKEVLAQKRESMLTPNISPTVASEAAAQAENQSFKAAQKLLKSPAEVEGVFVTQQPKPVEGVPSKVPAEWADKITENFNPFADTVTNEINKAVVGSDKLKGYANQGVADFLNIPGFERSKQAYSAMMQMLSPDVPMTVERALAIKNQMNSFYPNAEGPDRVAVAAMVDGFKNGIKKSLQNNLFQGEKPDAATEILNRMDLGDKAWQIYKDKYAPRFGGEKNLWTKFLNQMVDPNTGYISDKVTPQMLQMGQNLLDTNIMQPRAGWALYTRLQRTVGESNPAAMDAINASIRNRIITPKNPEDLSTLPAQIKNYTSGWSLPVTLQAFGAKSGDLRSLAVTAADDAATIAAKKSLADLQQYGKAIDLVYAKPGELDQKKSFAAALFKKSILPLAGGLLGLPHGYEAIVGALAGQGANKAAGEISGLLGARAQRAGTPNRFLQMEQAGQGIPIRGMTLRPAQSNVGALFPPDEQPNYGAPPVARARGGRINGPMSANQLLQRMKEVGKKDVNSTKPLLKLHDNTVATALAIANKHI